MCIGKIYEDQRSRISARVHRKIILPRLSQTLAPDRPAIEYILDVERNRNPAVAKFKAEGFYDSTFIDELRKEGY
jgi:hypothetical protein